jgi:hypothetical protein
LFLIQDGHQAHTKFETTLDAENAGGVIWSPADHPPNQLDALVAADYMRRKVSAIDTQFYVAPLADPSAKRLGEYELFSIPLRRQDLAARNLVPLTEHLIAFQAERRTSHILSPTVSVPSMTDRLAQTAADLADASIGYWSDDGDNRPLLISVAIEQSLLADEDNVDALLDELTSYECEGFYLLFELDPKHDPAQLAVFTERALYIIYTLAYVQEYIVWTGYAGFKGLAFRAAGADVSAGGWWQKQNAWSPGNWSAGSGGRSPRPRLHLESLLGSLLIDAELAPIARQRTDPELFSDLLDSRGQLAQDFVNGRDFDGEYPRDEMIAQLFGSLAEVDSRITGELEVDMRLALDDIAAAEVLHRRVRDVGIQVDGGGGQALLTVWQTAITALGQRLGIAF